MFLKFYKLYQAMYLQQQYVISYLDLSSEFRNGSALKYIK